MGHKSSSCVRFFLTTNLHQEIIFKKMIFQMGTNSEHISWDSQSCSWTGHHLTAVTKQYTTQCHPWSVGTPGSGTQGTNPCLPKLQIQPASTCPVIEGETNEECLLGHLWVHKWCRLSLIRLVLCWLILQPGKTKVSWNSLCNAHEFATCSQ